MRFKVKRWKCESVCVCGGGGGGVDSIIYILCLMHCQSMEIKNAIYTYTCLNLFVSGVEDVLLFYSQD